MPPPPTKPAGQEARSRAPALPGSASGRGLEKSGRRVSPSTDPTPSVRRRAAGLLKAAAAAAGATKAKIHVPGQARLDRVLDFVSFVASPLPLSELLDEAPKMIADIIEADVALLFLLEGDRDALVLRGSIGFPLGIRGTIRLGVGEGLT